MFQVIKNMFRSLKKKFEKNKKDPVKNLDRKDMERILIHLNGKDLLNCSLVNKNWNEIISKSNLCAEKLELKICESHAKRFIPEDVKFMILNARNYEHLTLKIYRKIQYVHMLLLASFKWKSLKIDYVGSLTEIELVNLLGTIEPNIEDLELTNIHAFSSKAKIFKHNLKYKFPKLKKLKIVKCIADTFLLTSVFNGIENLFEFNIETYGYHDSEENLSKKALAIGKIFMNNNSLIKLTLDLTQNDFEHLIQWKDLSEIGFQLEFLSLKGFRKIVNSHGLVQNEKQINHLIEFISLHKRLKKLELYSWVGNDILEFCMNNLCLNSLLIDEASKYGIHEDHIATMNIFKNETIEELTMLHTEPTNEYLQTVFLKALPCLKVLTIDRISQTTLDIIIDSNEKIEVIRCLQFKAFYPPEREYPILPCIKKIIVLQEYSRTFKAILRDYKNYTTFERVFLNAAKETDKNTFQ